MSDTRKTKAQLIEELQGLRQQVIELQESESGRERSEGMSWRSDEYLRILLDATPSGIVMIDAEKHEIVDANSVALEMVGVSPEQVIGAVCHNYICPTEKGHCPITDLGQTVDKSERVLLKADGGRVPILKTVAPITLDGRKFLLESFVDITELKQTQSASVMLNRELTALNRVGQALISALDLQETLTVITDHTLRLLGVTAASVVLLDQTKGDLWFAAASGEGADYMRGVRLIPGQGIAGWVVQHGEPVIVPDVSQDPRFFGDFDEDTGLAIRSILCVPLQTKGQTIGAIEVMNKESGTFDEEDLRLLTSLAAPAATAIETAWLYERGQKEIAERKRAEEALRVEQAYLEQLFGTIPEAIVLVDRDARIIRANNEFIGMFGYTLDEVLGQPIDELLAPDALREEAVSITKQVAEGKRATFETVRRRKDGTLVEVSILGTPVEVDGEQVALYGIYRDITARKQIEEELRQSEERYRAVEDSDVIGIGLVDPGETFTFVNPAFADMLGYTQDELMGMNLSQLADPEQFADYRERTTERKRGVQETYEATLRRKDGSAAHLLISAAPFTASDGSFQGTLAVIIDITERRQAEEALRVSEDRYALAVRGSRDGLWDWDIQNETLYWSPRLKELLGYADDELDIDFDTFASLMHPDDREHTNSAIEAHLEDRTPYEVEQRIRTKSGDYRWFLVRGQAVWDEDGRPLRMAGSTTDITESKQAREALRKAHDELERYAAGLERRNMQIQAAADVAREAAAILDVRQLLDTAVHLVSERFGFYHTGVFLVDEPGEYAILRAAFSEGGQRMLERGHRLRIGEVGIVGYVAATGEPRIALDVGEDAVFFDNPDLPDTRSEMALPLVARGRVIGVLDVQSTEPAAFSEEDMVVLQTMAGQLGVAIENARLVERAEAQLREVNRLYGEYSATAWAGLMSSERPAGYVYDRIDVLPTAESPSLALDAALERGETVTHVEPETAEAVLAIPLRVRDQIIGSIGVQQSGDGQGWSPEDIALVQAIGDQVAMALENARLFEETRIHAEEVSVLNELAQALTARLDVNEVVEETYRGVSRMLDTTSFYVALYDPKSNVVSFPLAFERGQRVRWAARQAGEGLTEYIIRSRQPLLIQENVDERLRELGIEMIGTEALSWLGVPLIVGGQVLGVMAAQSYATPHLYDEHDRDLLTAIASQTAIALQNARLFEDTQRRAQRERQIYEITNKIRRSPDIATILQTTVNELGQALRTDRALVRLGVKSREEQRGADKAGKAEDTREAGSGTTAS